jgi:anaerobic dimethyl sulfoxide reductase subunit A
MTAQKIPVSCNLDCGGGCPLLARVEGGRVQSISTNRAAGPFMAGCVRGFQMSRVLYDAGRILKPLLRRGPRGSGDFREASWDEALGVVAGRLAEIKARYGAESILLLGGSGSCRGALHNTDILGARFLSLFGGFTDTSGSYSSAALNFVTPYLFGTRHMGLDPATLQYSRLIILWGANVVDCRFGSEMEGRIRQARERGVEVVSIDPRRTTTVSQLSTQWIPIWPGTDAALMLAILYVLIRAGAVDRRSIERLSVGFEQVERYVLGLDDGMPKTPEWAAGVCGVPADVTRAFARQYAAAKPTALLPGFSIQRTIGGEDAFRLTAALQVATGNVGVLGGSAGGRIWEGMPRPRVGRLSVPANPVACKVPVYLWPDAILEGRAGGFPSDIRAVYNIGGNYLVQGSDVHKNIRALESVEFSVTHDYFLTPTARYADVVLPATTFLERNDIVTPTVGNFVLFSNRAVPPLGQARNDYDILLELAERLGFGPAFGEGKSEEDWLRSFVAGSDVPDYDEFRRAGIYLGADQCRVGLADFAADPADHPLPTPSGRIELASAAYARDTGFPAAPTCRPLAPRADYPLRLVTPKSRYRTHSQCSQIVWFRRREQQALWINPADAVRRGVVDGGMVEVSSPQGRLRIPARVTEDIMPGVVCLLAGIWPELDAEGVDHAGCANVLTSTEPTLPSYGSRTHSVLVQVTRCDQR